MLENAPVDSLRKTRRRGLARRITLIFTIIAAVLLVEAAIVHRYLSLAAQYQASAMVASRFDSDIRLLPFLATNALVRASGEGENGSMARTVLSESIRRVDEDLEALREGGSWQGRSVEPAPTELAALVSESSEAWQRVRPPLDLLARSSEALVDPAPNLPSLLARLRESGERLVSGAQAGNDAARRYVRYGAGAAIFAGMFCLIASFVFAWNGVVVPMRRLKEHAVQLGEIAATELPDDEIGAVSGVLTEMAGQRDRFRRERARMTEKLHRAEADYQSIFDNAVAGILRFDDKGEVLLANQALAKMLGYESAAEVEISVTDVHRELFEEPNHRDRFEAIQRTRGRATLESKARRRDGTTLWVLESARAAEGRDGEIFYETVMVDVTPMKKAQESLRELSGLLLRSQDSERRRIARELHDSTGQLLAALEMNLGRLDEVVPVIRETLSSSMELASECNRQIRSMSYLLHPPMLEELGLLYALRDYCRGFSMRSKIDVALDTPPEIARLESDAELAMFRVVQEALTNIQRHAESSDAVVRIREDGSGIRLEIEDHGRGIRPELLGTNGGSPLSNMGVGMRGMEERLRQLGGTLTIESERGRTMVRAVLPPREPVPSP